jgi:alpha-D-xyloside xylohydrolase
MFVHTGAPLTFDFGQAFDDSAAIYSGDDVLDLFIFLGRPAEVLTEYTALTGRSPLPPLWSFGLWMSRIWRESADKVRDSAANYRRRKIPCDVIHWDLGWYREPWYGCDWTFSNPGFPDAKGLLEELRRDGFRVSLWQNTYLTPGSPLFREALDKGYAILDADGRMCTDDAIIDLSNPQAEKWYQDKLQHLLELGVAVIKVDFGEAAPVRGLYASGRSGFYEHNLYALRYNKSVAEVTERMTGHPFIWARCAWAGSQRYPLHWGGDAESTDAGLAASLRAGLSMGLSGFAFWSHDVGGFVAQEAPPSGLMKRWLMFGLLSSHTRVHGKADKEPWVHYDDAYVEQFRRQVEFRYRLMPYVYAQAAQCSSDGTPMIRALLLDYPDDPTSWLIEDEYLFGRDMLVAPLLEDEPARQVYLPPGEWIDYQTRKVYAGGQWHRIEAGPLPVVLLVRAGTMIPHIALAQCTDRMNWSKLEAVIFATGQNEASGLVMLPGQPAAVRVTFTKQDADYRPAQDPLATKVTWQIAEVACTQ